MEATARILLVSLKSAPGFNIAPPVGLYQLRYFVSQRGVDCRILDRDIENADTLVDAARDGEFDVIGLSVSHVNMEEDLDLLWRFRGAAEEGGHDCVFIAGGQIATLNWKQWLTLGIDVVFLGFAEQSLLGFCERMGSAPGGPPDLEFLTRDLDGIAFCDSAGEFVYQPSPALTREWFRKICFEQVLTSDLPYHAYWEKLRTESADISMGAADFIIENVRAYTSSHCPRRCGFCNSQSFLPQSQGGHLPIIVLSAEEVMDLVLMYVDRYGARSFLFSDDDFPIGNREGLERLTNLCQSIIAHKRSGRISPDTRFSCQARIMDFVFRNNGVRGVNRDLLSLMAEAGFMSIGLGIETFSERLMSAPSIFKVGATLADCRNVLDTMLEVGLVPQINLILGVPEYTVDELAETMTIGAEYLRRGCDVAVVRTMLAMPGAPIFDSPAFEKTVRAWTNPYNGLQAEIPDRIVPHDPAIAAVIDAFDDAAARELEAVVERRGWRGMTIHKRIVGMCNLLGVARTLGREDLVETLTELLEDVLEKRLGGPEGVDRYASQQR
jgi:radical SAM superfamily enzyme YgiQ (UPF0313 family)